MPNNNQKASHILKAQSIRSALKILVIGLLIVALIAPMGSWMREKSKATLVLMQAKAVQLAVGNVVLEYFSSNQSFADQTRAHGMTDEAWSKIRELAQCEGDYYLLQWDTKNFRVKRAAYAEGDYTAVYSRDQEGEQHWQLYRTKSMLTE